MLSQFEATDEFPGIFFLKYARNCLIPRRTRITASTTAPTEDMITTEVLFEIISSPMLFFGDDDDDVGDDSVVVDDVLKSEIAVGCTVGTTESNASCADVG